MFFSDPVAALRNIRQSMAPGGRLCIVVWRRREDSPALYRAQLIVEALVPKVDKGDAVTCGPGPFSVRAAFAPFVKGDGVWMQSSSWTITATAP